MNTNTQQATIQSFQDRDYWADVPADDDPDLGAIYKPTAGFEHRFDRADTRQAVETIYQEALQTVARTCRNPEEEGVAYYQVWAAYDSAPDRLTP